MTDPITIFQRTHTGREEIHNKSHGLTQSERLVLIMVDGVTTAREIRAKLPVLSDDRFDRALQKLQAKELVLEVFMPLDGQAPEELERTIIDRFLQQDPMDPVTIILQDPEDELGLLEQARRSIRKEEPGPVVVGAPQSVIEADTCSRTTAISTDDIPTLVVPPQEQGKMRTLESALDAEDVQAADALSAELKARRAQRSVPIMQSLPMPVPEPIVGQDSQEISPFAVHWGYWLIVSGLSFILGFVLARATV